MTERTPKKRPSKFLTGMLVYAAAFLGVTAAGLLWFWSYMDAYEQSRPETAMDAYMERVDADYLCAGGAGSVIDAVDSRIQSGEDCMDYIRGALSGDIRYACKMSECSDEQMVYMVLCGERAVCRVTLTPQADGRHGFTGWAVAEEAFDLSHIQPATASITVPETFAVSIGGARLGEADITDSRSLSPDDAALTALPRLVTYRSGGFLGDLAFTVTDAAGGPVRIENGADGTVLLNNCTADETAQLDALLEVYIRRYVDFLSCANNDRYQNYWNLVEHLVPECALGKRFHAALDGLYWVVDRQSSVTDLTVSQRLNLGGGRYLCDVVYGVDTHLHSGLSHEITRARIIIAETNRGLKVESMTIQ